MTEENTEEKETLTLEIPLDPAHRRMELALRESGVEAEQHIEQQVAPEVEQALYAVLQATKYNHD